MSVCASEARRDLFPLIKRVTEDHTPVRVSSKSGDAVLMSADDYDAWQETVARDRAGSATAAKTLEELQALAGDE